MRKYIDFLKCVVKLIERIILKTKDVVKRVINLYVKAMRHALVKQH